jgi:hypothetical protein
MKRILLALLLTLLSLLTIGDASARPAAKKVSPKSAKEVLVDQDPGPGKRATAKFRRERKASGREERERERQAATQAKGEKPPKVGPPVERHLKKARGRKFDLRTLPSTKPKPRERPEREGPEPAPIMLEVPESIRPQAGSDGFRLPAIEAAAPAPILTFDGLDRENWGAGSPPDTTGDVGPDHYIQAVNTSVGVYRKSDGFRLAAFTFDTLMSQGNFGNMCDDSNFGDPVVLYDTFENRWIISDFAFQQDASLNVSPPIAYQCFAVSMTGDPVSGGWNFYSIEVTDGLHDYEKLSVWTDALYMSANMFGYAASATFQNARAWAINKAQMYAGSPTVQMVSFDIGGGDFTVIPSNARLQTGTPPTGSPNYFLSTSSYLNAVGVYKFHVDWNSIALSTFTGPDLPLASTSWPNATVANVPQSGIAQLLDAVSPRAMVQNQYTNIGGAESLWVPHTVRRGNTTGFAAPRWYQVDVTGGTVAANLPQAATWDPDAANVMHRWMPSLAVDRAGNLAMGYSTSSSTTFPSIKYAGRLATDPINTFSQTEQTLLAGTGSQTTSARWGDYSSMVLDPDGCTFWFTTEYANPVAQTFDKRWLTRVGSFRYPQCTMVGAGGTISGTVTRTADSTPISGATVALGARTATTDGAGAYSFTALPAGTYPLITASYPGLTSATATNIVVTDGGTTTQDFSLAAGAANACPIDTTQADFQAGVGTTVDLTTSPGNVTLTNPPTASPQNTTLGNQGAGFNTTTWLGQTFTATVTGPVVKVDLNLFSLNCGAVTMPNVTVSIRNAATNLPTGADLAVATIAGVCNGAGGYFTGTFATPVTLTSGTQYALVWRAAAAIPAGSPAPGYFGSVSAGTGAVAVQNPYAGGRRASSSNSGGAWTGASGNANNDHGFRIYVDLGYTASGNLVSSVKDSNPSAGLTPIWSNLTWNATVPANTTVRFQAAGSSSVNGPFTFVGPDGTAATFFTTSGASLTQFYGLRYLKYKAYLTTASSTVTPTVHDVQLCYNDTDCSGTVATITPDTALVCPASTGNTASGPAGASSYAWSITNGSIEGSTSSQSVTYTAGNSGNVDLHLSVVAPNECRASGTVSVPILIVAVPTITPGGPTTFCPSGSVTLTSSSATGNQWSLDGSPIGGATDPDYVATAAGSYTVTVTESGCVSAPSSATVITITPAPATPTITPGGPTTFCDGDSVTLTSSAADSYQWYVDGGAIVNATDQAYIATTSGDYTVVVTVNGCPSADSAAATVTVNSIPGTPTITPGGPTTFCTGGSVTLASSSATGNQWYLDGSPIGGATDQQYIAETAGSYTLIVTLNACPSTESAATVVTINPIPATPTATPDGPTTFCPGASVTLTSSSGAGNQWSLDGTPIPAATDQTYIASVSGAYTVVVTETGCASAPSTAVNVTVNPTPDTPTITPGGPTTFCSGGSVTLTSSSGAGNQWYLDGNPIGGETSQQYVATANGSYTVVVTESGCPSAASSATVVTVNLIPATPSITPGGPTTFCAGGSVTLTSSSASGNQWSLDGTPIGGATSQQYVATLAGDYTVIVTQSGCSSSASAATTVTVNPTPATPTITPGGPTTFCTGGNVTLTSSSAAGNQWSLNGNPIGGETSQQYLATANGSYTVVVTESGCPSAASSATAVTVNLIPATPVIGTGGPTTFCTGGSVTLTSSSASGNQWSLDGTPIGGATSQQYVATAAGDYAVIVTQSGCSSSASAATTVTVNPTPATPTITPGGPTTFCTGGSLTLTSSSAAGNQWYLNGNPIGGETSQQYVATASGSYTVVVTESGCPSAASAATAVTVNPIPATPVIGTGGPTTFCTGGSVTLTSSSASGNQWSLDGNPIGGATSQQYVATAGGDYTVIVTQSGCSSSASASATVTVNPTPETPSISPGGPTTFCAGGSVTLTSSGASQPPPSRRAVSLAVSPGANQWYLNGSPIGGATDQQYVATASGDYTVVVTTNGCPSAASPATTVTVNPIPATPVIGTGGPTTFCTGGSVTLTSSSASGNQWSLDGNPIGGATSQQYLATLAGDYTVIVTQSGCSSSSSSATTVAISPIPETPSITPGGPTTFCAGGSVTLASSIASGNQWYLNGNPIGGAIGQQYVATAAGDYTLTTTASGCASAQSSATTVTVNSIPATPTITPGGPTEFCPGGSVTLTSSSASGNQWSVNGNPIGAATGQEYVATAAGNYTVVVTLSGCPSASSGATSVVINAAPETPSISPGGPTTFCTGGSVTLTSSSATGNQWFLNGNPLGGEVNQTYSATATGNYTVTVTVKSCASAPSAATAVTVQTQTTPTVTPIGPTTFCTGGSVTLSSSSATGNQWLLNGNPLGGQTAQTLVVTTAGDYAVLVTAGTCSTPSSTTTVTVNATPNATITAPGTLVSGSTGNAASVANAGVGATYAWVIGNGSITAGAGTRSITFTAGTAGTLTLDVTVTAAGCPANSAASIPVAAAPPSVTVTSVVPSTGSSLGGTAVTINGTGFNAGATVTFGGTSATAVVRVSSTKLTAVTPAHAAGAVNVIVTNTNASTGTLTNGFTYTQQNFDPNGDSIIDPSDIFYLINYLFLGGPAPAGVAGMPSGDANGDGVVDPADIFYVVNYLFGHGPAPHARTASGPETASLGTPLAGSLSLGDAVRRGDRWFVPVVVTMDEGSETPGSLSLRVAFRGQTDAVTMHRGAGLEPAFEISRGTADAVSYLIAFSADAPLLRGNARSATVAEIEVSAPGTVRLDVDAQLTMLVGSDSTTKATVAGRMLRVSGTTITRDAAAPRGRSNQQ